MSTFSRNNAAGYLAGLLAGASYGMNPLFAKPLLGHGVSVSTMLVFRYFIATLIMAIIMMLGRKRIKINWKQMKMLVVLGFLFAGSSILLFESYNFIPSGLATTLIYLYPVFTALMMLCLKEYPNWQTWVSIIMTMCGVLILCMPSGTYDINIFGIVLAVLSSLSYTLYLVIINRSHRLHSIPANTITFYALTFGSILVLLYKLMEGGTFTEGISTARDWMSLISLAIFPTMLSLWALAFSTKHIGPTKTSVMGVAEPITAILIGTLFFSEPFTTNILIGVIICVAAVMLLILSGKKN